MNSRPAATATDTGCRARASSSAASEPGVTCSSNMEAESVFIGVEVNKGGGIYFYDVLREGLGVYVYIYIQGKISQIDPVVPSSTTRAPCRSRARRGGRRARPAPSPRSCKGSLFFVVMCMGHEVVRKNVK